MPEQHPETDSEDDETGRPSGESHASVQTHVPGDASAERCPYCGRPFPFAERVDLHVGLEHYDVCTDAEAEAFEDAYTAETEQIRLFRLKTTAVLVVLYFGLLIVYSVVT